MKTTPENEDQLALLERIMSSSPDVLRVMLVSTGQAALMLCCSVKWLENRRDQKEPPPPAPNYSGGKKGAKVMYLVTTLLEYIRGEKITQPSPWPNTDHLPVAKNAAAARQRALGVKGLRRHLAKYAHSTAEVDDATWPFFVDPIGRVQAPCWDTREATIERFFDESTDVEWLCWTDALAKVWDDESVRLEWMAEAQVHSPALGQKVQEIRDRLLSSL